MGFETLAVKLVAVADKISASLQDTVSHYGIKETIVGDYGEPTYGTLTKRKAIVELRTRLRRLDTGQEVLQKATITFPRPVSIDVRDKFVLPNGYTGPILNLEGVVNPLTHKLYLTEVIIG